VTYSNTNKCSFISWTCVKILGHWDSDCIVIYGAKLCF